SPVSGASTSSSSGTWWARASGRSSSRVGLRCPDSSRDNVLTEMPVLSASSDSVAPSVSRSARNRGPTPSSTSANSAILLVCQTGKEICQDSQESAHWWAYDLIPEETAVAVDTHRKEPLDASTRTSAQRGGGGSHVRTPRLGRAVL